MDENYEEQEEQVIGQQVETVPEFQYSGKQELELDQLIHSILIESSKTKSIIPECLVKQICESSGLECNEQSFFNLLGNMADFTLSHMLQDIKSIGEVSKNKKDTLLSTSQVRKAIEQQGIFMTPGKIIPQMGISSDNNATYNLE